MAGVTPSALASSRLALVVVRQELVQRRIEQADGHRQALHRLEDADEVLPLERQQLLQGRFAVLGRCRPGSSRRIAMMRSPSKNMCSVRHRPMPSAPNSRARLASAGVSALVRTLSVRYLSAHFITVAKSPAELRLAASATLADHHFAGRAVDARAMSLCVKVLPSTVILRPFSSISISPAPATQQLAPAAGDDRRVAGHAAGAGENAGRRVHAVDVFGAGFLADQQHLLAGVGPLDRFLGGEGQLADRRARRGRQADGQHARPFFFAAGSKLGSSSCVRSPAGIRSTAVFSSISFSLTMSQAIFTAAGAGPLAGAGLQHEELAALDGELDVLHVVVVLLERVLDLQQLLVDRLVPLGHFVDGQRRADAGHHVFALGVDQELAVELVLAGRRDCG